MGLAELSVYKAAAAAAWQSVEDGKRPLLTTSGQPPIYLGDFSHSAWRCSSLWLSWLCCALWRPSIWVSPPAALRSPTRWKCAKMSDTRRCACQTFWATVTLRGRWCPARRTGDPCCRQAATPRLRPSSAPSSLPSVLTRKSTLKSSVPVFSTSSQWKHPWCLCHYHCLTVWIFFLAQFHPALPQSVCGCEGQLCPGSRLPGSSVAWSTWLWSLPCRGGHVPFSPC